METEWVNIAHFDNLPAAEIFKGRLETEGIPASVVFERMSSSPFPALDYRDKGIAVRVPLEFAHKAIDVYYDSLEK